MSTSRTLKDAGKKRTNVEFQEDQEQVAATVWRVKKPRVEIGTKGLHAPATSELEESLERWATAEVERLFDAFIVDFKPMEGVELSDRDQHRFKEQLRHPSRMTAAEPFPKQQPTILEHHVPNVTQSTTIENLDEMFSSKQNFEQPAQFPNGPEPPLCTPIETSPRNKLLRPTVVGGLNSFQQQIMDELEIQEGVLRSNLLAGSSWVQKTPEEQAEREQQEFLFQTPARVQEDLVDGGDHESHVLPPPGTCAATDPVYAIPPSHVTAPRSVQYQQSSRSTNASHTYPTGLTGTARRKRRGAPRTIMFPLAPPSDTALSAHALVDDEEVLRHFPEHLSVPEIMRRFVRPFGTRSGAWPTLEMVERLLEHPNAKDYPGISESERRANLSRWVTKERDACNAKMRMEHGSTTKTSKWKSAFDH